MELSIREDQHFTKQSFLVDGVCPKEYDNCIFENCDFSNINLSNVAFSSCEFTACNLSTTSLNHTSFRHVSFQDCKLLGLHFESCNPFLFEVEFNSCVLNLSSFYQLKMRQTNFKNCSLHEVDFTETDLTSSRFENCDLLNAVFDHSILEKVDFRSAVHYSIDPESNRLKKARFSKNGLAGLLHKYQLEIKD